MQDGIRITTRYRRDEETGKRVVKITTKTFPLDISIRSSREIKRRRGLRKFGDMRDPVTGGSKPIRDYTMVSRDEVRIEPPEHQQKKPPSFEELWNLQALSTTAATTGKWTSRRQRGLVSSPEVSTKTSAYVPPARRAGASSLRSGLSMESEWDHQPPRIHISNLSEEATEDDLQELCQYFGRVTRSQVVRDRDTGQSRGFAFVTFSKREDAERAVERLNGHGYQYLILEVAMAKPRAESAPWEGDSGLSGRSQILSGYGKALPQDSQRRR